MKILFETLGSEAWMGGVNYIKNLMYSIKLADPETKMIHFGYFNQKLYGGETSPDETVIWESPYKRLPRLLQDGVLALQKRLPRHTKRVTKILNRKGFVSPDIIFQTQTRDFPSDAPVISWIPDFQHISRPDFFSSQEIKMRDKVYKDYAKYSDIVLLSSEDAKSIFVRHFPHQAEKARVYNFVSRIHRVPSQKEADESIERYDLPKKYIFMPNQFWAHKNHSLVVDAFEIVKKKDPDVRIVMSGAMYDHRWPDHVSKIVHEISRKKVRDMFILLGLIPYADVQNIFWAAHAILNPSRYEGWSTSVEEAKAFHKIILASDIPVHREQLKGLPATFFSVDDPAQLAEKVLEVWFQSPKPLSAEEILKENERLCQQAGHQFLKICHDAKMGR